MFPTIYIEKEILEHPRVITICKQFSSSPIVVCENYKEVFNIQSQNFRLQKEKPSLILAHKFKNWILPIPSTFGIGGKHNFYFSHMLNCIYDCRYCFLQGMYPSAHFVLFVNYEDFQKAIIEKIVYVGSESVYFFSGYDCDSLAMDQVSSFVDAFLPLFYQHKNAFLELRTKSINIRPLLTKDPIPNCITAFSLTPAPISQALEHKTPPIKKRLEAMQKLQKAGWPIGIRLDPMIYCDNYQAYYKELLEQIASHIDMSKLHSISLGAFRLPKNIFKKMTKLYPQEKLFVYGLNEESSTVSYHKELELEMFHYLMDLLAKYVDPSIIFPCGLGDS